MKKNNSLTVSFDELEKIEPITDNQKKAFDSWDKGYNLILTGSAGTGKTFIALYNAFKEMLDKPELYRRIMIMRSMVPTRDAGHLPGTKEEKEDPYKVPRVIED